MNTEWWKKIEDTYHSARELKAQERSDCLDAACGTDTALRRQVEVLLGQEENPDSLLNKPALAHAENLRSSATFPNSLEVTAGVPADAGSTSAGLNEGVTLGSYDILGL